MKETFIEGIITERPNFISSYKDDKNITQGMFDYEITMFSIKKDRVERLYIRTSFNIEKWQPIHKYERVRLSVLKKDNGAAKRIVSKDGHERLLCNIVNRCDHDKSL